MTYLYAMNLEKRIVFLFCFLTVLFLDLKSQEESSLKLSLEKQGIIIRVPTNGKKIKALKSFIAQDQNNVKLKEVLIKSLQEDSIRFALLNGIFENELNSVKKYFVPDSLYSAFLDGRDRVFLNNVGGLVSFPNVERQEIFLMSLTEKDQFLLTDAFGNRLHDALPYKKSIFLNSIKRVFNYKKFLITQVKYFEKAFENFLNEVK
ncbi:MAG: hypothetical protein R2774_10390 [Saprospiraceae bacterium]